jgi:hypothetical protein
LGLSKPRREKVVVAGHLQEKKGNFYIVLNYKGEYGKRKNKWIATGLPVKENKKKAESLLMEVPKNFVVLMWDVFHMCIPPLIRVVISPAPLLFLSNQPKSFACWKIR